MANLQHKICNKKLQKIKTRLICLGSSVFFLANQMLPVASAMTNNDSNLFATANSDDIQTLRSYFAENKADSFIPMNLISKNFELTDYEMLLMSELIKKDVSSRIKNDNEKIDAIKDLVDLQNTL